MCGRRSCFRTRNVNALHLRNVIWNAICCTNQSYITRDLFMNLSRFDAGQTQQYFIPPLYTQMYSCTVTASVVTRKKWIVLSFLLVKLVNLEERARFLFFLYLSVVHIFFYFFCYMKKKKEISKRKQTLWKMNCKKNNENGRVCNRIGSEEETVISRRLGESCARKPVLWKWCEKEATAEMKELLTLYWVSGRDGTF